VVLGLERLGLDLPGERVACDEGPRWRKPSPDGLLALSESLGAQRMLSVGDTVDDLEAASNARALGLDVAFAGIAPARSARAARFARGGAITVAPQVGLVVAWAREEGRR
jgi:phosphoglycolate phosphatase-like HAD superfamily hydrolase